MLLRKLKVALQETDEHVYLQGNPRQAENPFHFSAPADTMVGLVRDEERPGVLHVLMVENLFADVPE